MKKEKMTMKDRILKFMRDFGAITTFEAFTELGCTRLSEYIRQIRQDFNVGDEWVKGTNRYGEKVEWKKYFIID